MSSKRNKKKNAKKNKSLTSRSTSFSSVTDGQNDTPSLAPEHHDGVQSLLVSKDSCHKQGSDFHRTPDESGDPSTTIALREAVVAGSSCEEDLSSTSKNLTKCKAKKMSHMKSEINDSSEQTFTFEEQVEWCIGQLELGLLRHDATTAQKDSNERNIKTLRSPKVPVPRKRQLMRSLFGDYRSKMVVLPLCNVRSSSVAKQPHVSVVEKEVADSCGKFFKYKHSCSKSMEEIREASNGAEEQQMFRFNFVID